MKTPPTSQRAPAHKERIAKQCLVCSQDFSVPYCFRNQKTCSNTCKGILHRKAKVEDVCRGCGKVTLRLPSLSQPYCSNECKVANWRGEDHPQWLPPSTLSCKQCGEDFQGKGWRKLSIFCSYACHKQWRIITGIQPRSVPIGTVSIYDGYRVVKVAERKWFPEHRLIVEKRLGRSLLPHEIVHHRDGDQLNNGDENLQVVTRKEHMRIHHEAEKFGLMMLVAMENEWNPSIEGMAC